MITFLIIIIAIPVLYIAYQIILEKLYPFSDDYEIKFKCKHYWDNWYTLLYSCNGGRTYKTINTKQYEAFYDNGSLVIDDYTFEYNGEELNKRFRKIFRNYTAVKNYEERMRRIVKEHNDELREDRRKAAEKRRRDLGL